MGPLSPNAKTDPQNPFGGGNIGGQILNFGPDFPKIGESPTPKFYIFGKP